MTKEAIHRITAREVIGQTTWFKLVIMAVVIGSTALAVACGGGGVSKDDVNKIVDDKISTVSGGAGASKDDVNKAIDDKLNNVVGAGANADGNDTLWKIQPGGGTVMMEYNSRMANSWFAAQAGNWDMASYQFGEMLEVQEVFETTRPAKAADLKKFEDEQLTPLMNAAKAKDLRGFNTQYPLTLDGCNACHKKNDVPFVKVVPPSVAATQDLDWKGQ